MCLWGKLIPTFRKHRVFIFRNRLSLLGLSDPEVEGRTIFLKIDSYPQT